VGLAIWHFTIFLRDRFWGGIVGAIVCGVAVNGLTIILGESETHALQALEALPGALIGIGVDWIEGVRRGNAALEL
jgi:hypothetical protein